MKKTLLIIAALLVTQICFAQVDTAKKAREVYNQEFKWRMTIPEGFQNITDEQYAALKQKGDNAIKGSSDKKVEDKGEKIFSFNSGVGNTFDSSYQLFDSAVYGDFQTNFKNTNNILFDTFAKQMPAGTKLDSTSTTETISNLTFKCFKVNMTLPNSMQLNFLMFSRLFDNNMFTVAMVYSDKQKGDQILTAWRNSKFE
jgi:hypothetical protein